MNNLKRSAYISSPAKKRLVRKRRKSPFWGNVRRFLTVYKTSVLVVIILILLCVIVRLIYGFTIGKSENIIREIVFTDEDLQMYDNKDIYTFIREQLYYKNAVVLKMKNGGEAKDIIVSKYPFIDDLTINKI